jgi:hypothetical protein
VRIHNKWYDLSGTYKRRLFTRIYIYIFHCTINGRHTR